MEVVEAGRPGCIAANHNSVYYIAKTFIGTAKAFVLVKTSSFTASSTNTWSVVSVTPSANLASVRVWDFINDSDCSVDSNGVFTWRSYMDQFTKSIRYDPNAPWISTSGTTNPGNKTHGEWNSVMLTQPGSFHGQIQLIDDTSDAKDTLVVYFPQASDRDPASLGPSIEYVTVKTEKDKIDMSKTNLARAQLAITNSTVHNVAFGDGQLFSILRSAPVEAPDASIKYNKNLFYFPFTPNLVLSSPPASMVTIPWDPMCRDHPYDDQSEAAVANGKFYYLCEAPEIPSQPKYSNLYIYDSVTSMTRGPVRLEGTFNMRHFTLAYGSAASPADPQFIFLNSNRTVQVVDLATGTGAFVTMTNITGTMKPPALTVDPLPITSDATACVGSCKHTGVIVAATVVPILVFAAAAAYLLWRRRKKARTQPQGGHELSQLPRWESVTDLPPYVADQRV
ncbi:MAG: hypothetical protein BYD32DRAFT_437392 [Podila humilis]|nr:MAG: hypothetical protein BYD32DRAFT_437392 [Podila humilis]